jgi:prevent-host-death family protein
MKITRDIQTVSEFKQNASKLVKQVQKTKQPIILTVNGKPAVVMHDVETYEAMADDLEFHLTMRALDEALTGFDERKNWPTHDEVFSRFRDKNEIK